MIAALLAGAAVLGLGCVLWLRRGFLVVTVRGASMEPTFRDGQRVLMRRCRPGSLRTGDVAVLTGARDDPDLLIKRVAALPGEPLPPELLPPDRMERVPSGSLVVLGDNRATSMDSRHYGYVSADRLLGTVVRTM